MARTRGSAWWWQIHTEGRAMTTCKQEDLQPQFSLLLELVIFRWRQFAALMNGHQPLSLHSSTSGACMCVFKPSHTLSLSLVPYFTYGLCFDYLGKKKSWLQLVSSSSGLSCDSPRSNLITQEWRFSISKVWNSMPKSVQPESLGWWGGKRTDVT